MLGLNAMRETVRSACIESNIASEWVGRRCGSTDMIVYIYILFKIIFYICKTKIMPPPDLDEISGDKDVDVDIDIDDDEDSTENDPLLKPTTAPQKPPDSYAGSHEMTERSGLPKPGPKTGETSFIEGEPSGRVLTAKNMATVKVEKDYPSMDHSKVEAGYGPTGTGTGAIIEVKMRNKTKWYPLYTKKGAYRKTLQRKTSKRNPISSRPFCRGFRLKRLKSSKRFKKSKSLTKLSKRTEGLQMTKMNNLLYVTALVKKLEKIPKEDHNLHGSKTSLNR